ncbi:hypothetical protein [Pendulispora albinea]|uniref:Uncharacterized protein n=1 Tax=Pendulispora albinea TaxID=2741071 RepID=A0ABZ2M2V0_9BACT
MKLANSVKALTSAHRTKLQRAVFWSLAADFVILYLGAVKLDNPTVMLAGMVALGLSVSVALLSF